MSRNDQKNSRKRGAQTRQNTRGGKPWPYFLGGLLLGLLIAGGAYLLHILPSAMALNEKTKALENASTTTGTDKSRTPKNTKAPGADAEKSTGEKPLRFDFYTLLPQQEVVAPVTGNRTTTATPLPQPTTLDKPSSDKPAGDKSAPTGQVRFLLQAGSFRTRTEADRRRAELLLAGHNVNVQSVIAGNNENWFRVMVGPFDNEANMQQSRQQLAADKIETLPIRLK